MTADYLQFWIIYVRRLRFYKQGRKCPSTSSAINREWNLLLIETIMSYEKSNYFGALPISFIGTGNDGMQTGR